MQRLLSELRRRNVFRVAGAYLVMAWLIMQIAAVLESGLGLPDWFDAVVIGFVGLGFPVAILLAWAFEMTPDGIRKTQDGTGETEFRPLGPTDYVLIGLLVIVVGFMGMQMVTNTGSATAPAESADDPQAAIAEVEAIADSLSQASIAVLPFADMSPGGDQQYFSDGIAEELLNALAQFPELKVAARTSAFSFRDDVDLRQVGEALGVAHVLEGSVRQSGDRFRITAQLIRTSDGFHLWSDTYDRTMTDMFEVQDEIVTELSRVLQIRLGVGAGEGRAVRANVDPRAHEQYLRGLSLWANRVDFDNRWNAMQAFRRATEIDPGFVDAWASYGVSLVASDFYPRGMPRDESNALGIEALQQAIEIDPDSARAHSGLSTYYAYLGLDMDRALYHGQRAMTLAPNAAHSNYFYGSTLFRAGDIGGAMTAFDRALSIDVLNDIPVFFYLNLLVQNGRYRAFLAAWERCVHCDEGTRLHLTRRVINHNGTEAEVRVALAEWSDWLLAQEPGSDGTAEDVEWIVNMVRDLTEVLLNTDGAGAFFSAELIDARADLEDAAVLAHLGEDERALDILFNLHRLDGQIAPQLEQILTPGRYEFPERTRRHPRYHEYWAQPGMARLAEIRRANGAIAGLPLPIESDE